MAGAHIRRLRAENFRNLAEVPVEFSPGINCIFGPNGNGKTNLLEAVHLLTNRRSFRKNTGFAQMLNIEGQDTEIKISAVFADPDRGDLAVSGRLREVGDEWWLENRPEKAKFGAESVFLNPFDSYAFHTSASFRRQWLDSHLGQLDPEYRKALNKFVKALRQRNSLLAGSSGSSAQLQLMALDRPFSELAAFLVGRRLYWAEELNRFITPAFREIFAENHELLLGIDTRFRHADAAKIYDHYRQSEKTDFLAGLTRSGIHRDDTLFSFDGLNSFEFCSLGQQKAGFLSLMFAFIELFRYKFSFYPIVLIDDVSGELDSDRWKNLIHYLRGKTFQVLITTANENFRMELEKIPHAHRIFMGHGRPETQG